MKLAFVILLPCLVSSFSVVEKNAGFSTQLEAISRRQVLLTGTAALGYASFPSAADAFSQQLDDFAYEPQQQKTDGKLDLNAAFVGEYKQLRGMFPSAGKFKFACLM